VTTNHKTPEEMRTAERRVTLPNQIKPYFVKFIEDPYKQHKS
jgi:hypothetical protein